VGAEASDSWDGRQYEEVSSLQRRIGLRFVADLDAGAVHRLLDVGCGDGFLTAAIVQKLQGAPGQAASGQTASGIEALGIDVSPGMIETALGRSDPSLHFEVADLLSFGTDAPFDLIVSLNTLHWVTDLATAFARLASAQAIGGRMAVQLVGADEPSNADSIEDVAMEIAFSPEWSSRFAADFQPYVHPTARALSRIAEAAGYGGVEARSWQERFEFSSTHEFEHWCAVGMTVWTDHIQPDGRDAFVQAVVGRYQERIGRSATLLFTQTRLTATKVR
jgi:trans-aconitate 2-methyltransferase